MYLYFYPTIAFLGIYLAEILTHNLHLYAGILIATLLEKLKIKNKLTILKQIVEPPFNVILGYHQKEKSRSILSTFDPLRVCKKMDY